MLPWMSEIEEVISILFFLQFTLIVILLQIIAKEKKKRRTEIIISRITLQYFIRSNFNIKKRSLKNLKNPQNALGTFLPRTLWIQKYLQQPSTTSLNSIKRNIVSENGTSFVVSNRGLNLSFIATRLYPASSSHDDYKFHPHRVSYSKLYRFCEYDIETRTLETVRVCARVYAGSYVWKIHDYRSRKKVYRRRKMHRTWRRKRRPRRNRKSVERKAILPDETSATVFRST